MLDISSAAIAEKNKIATDSVWVALIEIQLPGETLRLCANNENLSWNSQTWQKYPVELGVINDSGKGEIPAVTVKVSNVTGEIQQYLEAADGADGSVVIIRVINTQASSNTQAELELSFVLDSSSFDEETIVFKLTGGNCLTRRVPARRYLSNFCPFNYGGVRCGVSAATQTTYTTCNKTYANCTERSNQTRFGGFKWMPKL